jgi:acyl dehydratase
VPVPVGDILDVVEVRVEPGKIREFAKATFTTAPVHRRPDAPLATLTHSIVTAHERDQRGFVAALGLDISRIVVGSVSWRYLRPLVAGDVLVATRRVVSDESREGRAGTMRLVTLETGFEDATGALVQVVREVLIERPPS